MDYLSLFTGAGGGDLGMQHLLGFRCRGYVEYEPYCQEVIKQRITDGLLDAAPIFGDIRAFVSEGYAESYQGLVDVITGGFPCQDISCAGSGKGLDGERSGLWREMVSAIRIIKPRYVFVENSPMLTIRGLGTVLRDLASMGFDARWGVFSAADVGAPHIRERIWILAHTNMHGCEHKTSKKQNRATKIRDILTQKRGKFPIKRLGSSIRPIIDIERLYSSELNRANDGISAQLDRIKALGNAQVPIVAATAFHILSGGLT